MVAGEPQSEEKTRTIKRQMTVEARVTHRLSIRRVTNPDPNPYPNPNPNPNRNAS